MAHVIMHDAVVFEDHPLFEKVKIAKLAGSAQNSPVGVSILELEPGAEIPVHTHDENADSIYVLEGNAQVYGNGEWFAVSAGDYCLVPKGEEHGVRNGTGGTLRLFIVHAPPLF